ncbi:response regulator transcription factor [Nakamurella flava]|uniref:Response regulator transcription factor n=1 Tax=Nakamurella flava TaxID=2576308 RepID=A0A4U6QJN0_9ACTN|nr:response regulator transcription factor [Nakamurella flava]TKV60680.1 response regulator transcription factor [Nakamurella flava]
MSVIRVLLVDDHDFLRISVSSLLARAGGIEVVGECADGARVLELALTRRPHVVLMDIQLPGRSGIDVARELIARHPMARVLMLTGSSDQHWLLDSRAVGAAGFLVKSGDPAVLVAAVRAVASGGSVWPDHRPTLSLS